MFYINKNTELDAGLLNIKGYEGLYGISPDGRVFGYKRKKFLTPRIIGRGYQQVSLHKDGKSKQFLIHRLVAETYISNPNGLPQVNHINEDKTDNRVENLEWTTAKENDNHGTRNKRIAKSVYCVELDKTFESQTEAAKELGISRGNISSCCKGKLKTAGGYHFRYKEVEQWLFI